MEKGKKVKVTKRSNPASGFDSSNATPAWMSSGFVGAGIAALAWYAQKNGLGGMIDEETIKSGILEAVELGGIVMAALGRLKARTRIKLW